MSETNKKLVFHRGIADRCVRDASEWYNNETGGKFKDCATVAMTAVAEYLANQQGATVFGPPQRKESKLDT